MNEYNTDNNWRYKLLNITLIPLRWCVRLTTRSSWWWRQRRRRRRHFFNKTILFTAVFLLIKKIDSRADCFTRRQFSLTLWLTFYYPMNQNCLDSHVWRFFNNCLQLYSLSLPLVSFSKHHNKQTIFILYNKQSHLIRCAIKK